ncbi:hypothetical protein KBC03_00785 [Patescibacteria group bacterium]|nr:hypothetical protein [Patescibacteria group bacterium]
MRNKKITLRTTDQGLGMGEKVVSWLQLAGRSVEIDAHTGERRNLIIITKGDKLIFTLDDAKTNVDAFTNELSQYLPLTDAPTYSFTEKLIRKLKL